MPHASRAAVLALACLFSSCATSTPAGTRGDVQVLPDVLVCVTAAPRPWAPASGAVTYSTHPELRWHGRAGVPSRVELCADPACAHVLDAIDTPGTDAIPVRALEPGVVFWRVTQPACDASAPAVRGPVWSFRVPRGARETGSITRSAALDVDGDGFEDIAVGGRSQVAIYRGSSNGLESTAAYVLRRPPGASESFGFRVVIAGDVNGDGFADLLVDDQTGPVDGHSHSRAYVFHGGALGPESLPATTLEGSSSPMRYFAVDMGGGGDVNGDGFADVFVEEVSFDVTHNVVYVFHGGPGGIAPQAARVLQSSVQREGARYGAATAMVGDVDGDGFGEIAVAEEFNPPTMYAPTTTVYLYRGAPSGVAQTPSRRDEYGAPIAGGIGLASVSDLNGDGYGDYALALAGRILFVPGGPTARGYEVTRTQGSDEPRTGRFGSSWQLADMTGDGVPDWVVGSRDGDPVPGRIFVLRTVNGVPESRAVFTLETYSAPLLGSAFGAEVRVLDADGDGALELVATDVMAGYAPSAGFPHGEVYVYDGQPGGWLVPPLPRELSLPADEDFFGTALAMFTLPATARLGAF